MDITLSELADVIDDPFERREIMRALEEAEESGELEQADAELLKEHALALLTLNNKEVTVVLAMAGSDAAMLFMMFGGADGK